MFWKALIETFDGEPFDYDPSLGNLLLDGQYVGCGARQSHGSEDRIVQAGIVGEIRLAEIVDNLEPSTMVLLGGGLAGLFVRRRRRNS
jgi:hypothetical protein